MGRERTERILPERVEEGPDARETGGVEGEVVAGALPVLPDQSGRFEHLEVLRDRGPADWNTVRQLADGQRLASQLLDERQPRRVAENLKLGAERDGTHGK